MNFLDMFHEKGIEKEITLNSCAVMNMSVDIEAHSSGTLTNTVLLLVLIVKILLTHFKMNFVVHAVSE